MQLRRFKDIIAVKSDTDLGTQSGIVAFHATNLEVAEISEEAFNEMALITYSNGEIPSEHQIFDFEARQQLKDWNEYINQESKNEKLLTNIQSITLNINQICNLKCAYCAAGGDGTYGEPTNQLSVERTLPQLKYFMSKLPRKSIFAISFVGGEPLLHPLAINAIYDYVVTESSKLDLIPKMKIVTNGTLLNNEVLELIKKMKIHLTISFDAIKQINDQVRPSKDGKSTTDKILNGLNNLSEDRGEILSIDFSSITSKDNTNIFENYLFFKTLNPTSMDFIFANDEKDIETQKKHILGIREILNHAWLNGGELEIRKIKSVDIYFKMLDSQQRTENYCGAGKNYLMIDSKNRVYTCVWDANYKSEIVGTDLTIDNEKLSKLSKSLLDLNNCNTCWARYLCGGGCMHINRAHTGSKHKKSDLFCERTRSLISEVIMYYKLARSAEEKDRLRNL